MVKRKSFAAYFWVILFLLVCTIVINIYSPDESVKDETICRLNQFSFGYFEKN